MKFKNRVFERENPNLLLTYFFFVLYGSRMWSEVAACVANGFGRKAL